MPNTPPEITNGSYVAWDGGKGRVDLVVTNGKVPGVDDDVEGSAKSPAARVVVWENGKATGKKLAAATHTLRRIPPIREGKALADPTAALISRLAEHEDAVTSLGLPTYAAVSGKSLARVYDRGVKSWPGSDITSLSPQHWALGRVDQFLKGAVGDVVDEDLMPDRDLLDPSHPDHVAGADTEAPVEVETPADEQPQRSLIDRMAAGEDIRDAIETPAAEPTEPAAAAPVEVEEPAEPTEAPEAPAEEVEEGVEVKAFRLDREELDDLLGDLLDDED